MVQVKWYDLQCMREEIILGRDDDMKLKVILEPSEDGGYTVHVPSLPGCISEGDTREEAIGNILEAIALHNEVIE